MTAILINKRKERKITTKNMKVLHQQGDKKTKEYYKNNKERLQKPAKKYIKNDPMKKQDMKKDYDYVKIFDETKSMLFGLKMNNF